MQADESVPATRQLHVVSSVASRSGGEGLAALRFSQEIAKAGCVVILLSLDALDERPAVDNQHDRLCVDAMPKNRNFLIEILLRYREITAIFKRGNIDFVHIHGMWTPYLALFALAAQRARVPYIVSPHGCLERQALGYKKVKKWIALMVYQAKILKSAKLLVATSEQERESIRGFGLQQPVAVIPNGVDVPAYVDRINLDRKVQRLLFLSRVHPKKGLDDLILAWSRVRRPDWEIVVAGDGDIEYIDSVKRRIKSLGLEKDFYFVGFVEGAAKEEWFRSSDVFVLPTHSENFGIAIAEALAHELPVLTTKGAPWSELLTFQCGWWVEPGVDGLSRGLVAAMDSPPAVLREMGMRGRVLVAERYSWNTIGLAGFELGEWLVGRRLVAPDVINAN